MHLSIKIAVKIIFLLMFTALSGCGSDTESIKTSPPTPIDNAAPILDKAFVNIQTDAGVFFAKSLEGSFSDEGNVLISATEKAQTSLPDWLWFDSERMILSGIGAEDYTSSTIITITATDVQGLSTSTNFTLSITPISSKLSDLKIAEDQRYIDHILLKESQFLQVGVGVNQFTALTHDGIKLNGASLELSGSPSAFSAPSKESLHLNLLAKVILNNAPAQRLLAGDDVSNVVVDALAVLEQKITSYEEFNADYPAFGGFLPWFESVDKGAGVKVYPLSGWEDRLPALDNGQLAWSMFLVYKSLYKIGEQSLAARYEHLLNKMANNAKTIFFDPQRNVISGVSQFVNPDGNPDSSLPPEQLRYLKNEYGLTDSFEGELMAVFMTLFSPDLSAIEKQGIWTNKFLNTREYTTESAGQLTVIEGWAFSAHEQWKYLVLPYVDYPVARNLFLNGEKVRADFSNQNQFRGFFASVNTSKLNYVSLLGVQAVASEAGVVNTDIAPYATFPMLLADNITKTNEGLTWLRNVLAYDKMLGPYGITESYNASTYAIAPFLTWDGKVLTDLAMLGGVYKETRNFMLEEGMYFPFLALLEAEYNKISIANDGVNIPISEPVSSPVPIDPCYAIVAISGMFSNFECQQPRILPGVSIVKNPGKSELNQSEFVGRYVDPSGPWDALVIEFNTGIDFSNGSVFSIKVLAPVSGILKAKLEGGSASEVEYDIPITQLNKWVEYRFDFSGHAGEDHKKLVVFFNAGISNQGNDNYFIDDLKLSNDTGTPQSLVELIKY